MQFIDRLVYYLPAGSFAQICADVWLLSLWLENSLKRGTKKRKEKF